jgi:hypothetical protein
VIVILIPRIIRRRIIPDNVHLPRTAGRRSTNNSSIIRAISGLNVIKTTVYRTKDYNIINFPEVKAYQRFFYSKVSFIFMTFIVVITIIVGKLTSTCFQKQRNGRSV